MVVNTFPDISALIETTGPPAVDHDIYIQTVFLCVQSVPLPAGCSFVFTEAGG